MRADRLFGDIVAWLTAVVVDPLERIASRHVGLVGTSVYEEVIGCLGKSR